MTIDMHALARVGAERRLQELQAEIEQIQRAFPGIGVATRGRPRKIVAEAAPPPKRKRPTMSAEGRARIAEAQRKRWAALKKKKD